MNKINSIRPSQEQLYVTPKIGYVDSDTYRLQLWATFSGDIHASPRKKKTEPQTHCDFNASLLKQQTRLLLHYGERISLARPTTHAAFFTLS